MSSSTIAPDPSWRPRAIVFDLLTALLDSWSVWALSVPPSAATSSTDNPGHRWRNRYLELTFGAGAYVPYEDLVRQSAADTSMPTSAPTSLVHNWSSLLPWPEVPDVLVRLQDQGYKIGVVTNCSKQLGEMAVRNLEMFVRREMRGAGKHEDEGEEALGEEGEERREVSQGFRVDAMVTAEESGFYKPVPRAYEAVLDRFVGASGETESIRKEDVLFVAGSAYDVQGATDAGFKVVWHNQVGLSRKGEARALREGKTLEETLRDYL